MNARSVINIYFFNVRDKVFLVRNVIFTMPYWFLNNIFSIILGLRVSSTCQTYGINLIIRKKSNVKIFKIYDCTILNALEDYFCLQ